MALEHHFKSDEVGDVFFNRSPEVDLQGVSPTQTAWTSEAKFQNERGAVRAAA
jgi:hypothetical protein